MYFSGQVLAMSDEPSAISHQPSAKPKLDFIH
jgi:hypothetical protein